MSASALPRPMPEAYELPVSGSLTPARRGTAVTGVAALISALIGLRYGEQWLYQSDQLLPGQIYGHDLLVALVVLPVLALSVRGARRGSARALITWAGSLVYLAYWYHFMLDGIDFGPAYLVHLTVVGGSLFSLGALGARLDVERYARRFGSRVPARTLGGLMAVTGSLVATASLLDIMLRLRRHEIIEQAIRGIYTVDLTIMLPVTIVAGALLWRHESWGYVLAGPLLVNATLSVATLLAAAIILDDAVPFRATLIAALGAAALVLLVGTVAYVRGARV